MTMKIKSIHGRNIKGRSFDHELAPVTIITGPNSAGKTAIAKAVQLALLGYVPELGRRPGEIFRLCGGPKGPKIMTAGLNFDGEQTITRTWMREKSSVKYSITATPGLIEAADGRETVIPEVMMDLLEYFNLSGKARTDYVFRQVDPATITITPEGVMNEIEKLKQEHPFEAVAALIKLAKDQQEPGQTLQDWLSQTEIAVNEWKKTLDQEAKRLQAVNIVGAQNQADETATFRPDIDQLLEKAREERDRLNAALAQILQKASAAERAKGIRASAAKIIEEAKTAADEMQRITDEAGPMKIDADRYVSVTEEWRAKEQEASREALSWSTAISHARSEIEKLEAKAKTDLAGDRCPCCRSRGKAWRESYTEDLTAKVDEFTHKLKEAEAGAVEKKAVWDDALAKRKLAQEADAAQQKRMMRLQELRGKYTAAQNRVKAADQARKTLEEFPEPEGDPVTWRNQVEGEFRSADANYKALTEEQKRKVAAQQDSYRREQTKEAQEKNTTQIGCTKAAASLLVALKERLTEETLGKLVTAARQFTDGILPKPLEFREGEIGYIDGLNWVSHETLGGAEQAMVFAGLSVALCQSSKCKVVVMDELAGHFTKENKVWLVGRMAELCEKGILDNFIGIEPEAEDYEKCFAANLIKVK